MTGNSEQLSLIQDLKIIVGTKYLLTDTTKKEAYTKGFRFGSGEAIAVAKPES